MNTPQFDQRGRLGEEPFDFRVAKDGQVWISWQGRVVTTLKGSAAQKFLRQVDGLEGSALQLVMARVTGHFKHGNER
ncbi:MAG TPA: hypothetical protein PKW33_19365 [Anaerolineaceae bacterium]|nr:hypothetical protein [Anaerolineaceae bacterium]HPN53763.1 hypothetical protein [Anaerolineaceae bacterium]